MLNAAKQTVNTATMPLLHRNRSKFNLPDHHIGTCNLGEAHILDWRICVPGDTFKISEKKVIRIQPMVSAPMDQLQYQTFWFKMDLRDLWDSFKLFVGESTSKWRDTDVVKVMPKLVAGENGFELGSTADDLGATLGSRGAGQEINALPFRMYAAIINNYFRSTVVEDEIYVPTDDADQTFMYSSEDDPVNGPANGQTYIVNRNVDYLSLASIEPQRGPSVQINLGEITGNVFGNGKGLGLTNGTNFFGISGEDSGASLNNTNNGGFGASVGATTGFETVNYGKIIAGVPTKEQITAIQGASYDSTGLIAELNGAPIITINELRNAFALQRYYESLSLWGNRYKEIIKALFSVDISDRSLHIPEFIGGKSIDLQVYNSVQNSATGDITPQGNVVGYSVTADDSYIGEVSCDDFSLIMCIGVARLKQHTYSQGLDKDLLISTFNQLYQPLFDSLGDDSILNAEIYAQPGVINPDTGKYYDDEVFGYQERFYTYRNGKSRVSGQMRPDLGADSLPWTFTDNYNSLPHLSRDWMKEDKALLDRCLAVTSSQVNQFYFDYIANLEAIRPMSVHSIPGAIIR